MKLPGRSVVVLSPVVVEVGSVRAGALTRTRLAAARPAVALLGRAGEGCGGAGGLGRARRAVVAGRGTGHSRARQPGAQSAHHNSVICTLHCFVTDLLPTSLLAGEMDMAELGVAGEGEAGDESGSEQPPHSSSSSSSSSSLAPPVSSSGEHDLKLSVQQAIQYTIQCTFNL